MDVKFVRPFFRDGKLLSIVANTGHWPDVGGMTPGGFTPISTDIYQEGLRIPPMRIVDGGILNQPLLDLMLANIRVSDDRLGDITAHLNALDLGVRRLEELFSRFGADLVLAAYDELKARSEALMRSRIAALPDGTYHVQEWLDSDGIRPEPVLVDLKMIVTGSNITFDLSGSAPELTGPFNSPYSSSVSGLLVGVKHVFADIPINAGCFAPFDFVIPLGCMFNPRPPAPVSGTTTEATQRLSVLVMAALAQAMPGQVPAGSFATGSNISIGGNSPTYGRFATIFFFGGGYGGYDGGYGGYDGGDGLTNGSNIVSAARNSSIEVLEKSVPLLFTCHAVRENSAGDGEYRGGLGVEVAFHLRDGEATLSLVGDRGRQGPHGLGRGSPGQAAAHDMHVGDRRFTPEHLTKIGLLRLAGGDGAHLRTPGGGGFGDPARRSAKAREGDVENGYVKG